MFESRGWDDGLDEAQLTAATHGDAPLVILAGAGTGKTRTLVARVAQLVDRGLDPSRILLLTFTRRAADDMLARASAICGDRAGRQLWGGTFHAVAHKLVSAHAETLGLPARAVCARSGRRARPHGPAAHPTTTCRGRNSDSPAATRWSTSTRVRSTRRAPRVT